MVVLQATDECSTIPCILFWVYFLWQRLSLHSHRNLYPCGDDLFFSCTKTPGCERVFFKCFHFNQIHFPGLEFRLYVPHKNTSICNRFLHIKDFSFLSYFQISVSRNPCGDQLVFRISLWRPFQPILWGLHSENTLPKLITWEQFHAYLC